MIASVLLTAEEKEGSTFKVSVESIREIANHPNADRLELATVLGWQTVVPKGQYKVGDLVVYIPIDSILPHEVESALFGPDSKVKLSKSRVKTIKLRGAISQGMVATPAALGFEYVYEGFDVTASLKITKYEPPVKDVPAGMSVRAVKALENPNFRKYGGLENAKNYPDVFTEGEEVYVTEKIHGTNFRAGYVPTVANTFWKKILKFFGRLPEYEFVYGSNNVQLQHKDSGGFYGFNVYKEAVESFRLKEILKPNEVVYGEIYGGGIQKNYNYGLGENERKLVLFDLRQGDTYSDPVNFTHWCDERGLPRVPVLYKGPYNREAIKALTLGNSVLEPKQKVREGIVVKPLKEERCYMGRKALKFISDLYLLEDQSDFH